MSRKPATALARAAMLLALCAVVAPARSAPPEFPPPENATITQVADSMTIYGRTMSVRAFVSEDPVEDIVAFYQELWKDPPVRGAPGVAYEPEVMAPWHLLTRVEDGFQMTVQVQAARGGGSFGYLARGRLPEPGTPPEAAPEPPAMQGSEVLSNVLSDDPGKSAQTIMLVNESSLESNLEFYRGHYADWRKDVDQPMGHGKLHALAFTRGRRQVIITIESRDRDGSRIVVNSVEHDLL